MRDLSIIDFAAIVDDQFEIHFDENHVEIARLTKVSKTGKALKTGWRDPFSLLFTTPQMEYYFQQRIYRVSHKKLGELDIFLVPVGRDKDGMNYEAVFT